MRETTLYLRFRCARDWSLSRDDARHLAQIGKLAVQVASPSFLRSSTLRPVALFHFLSQTSAQADQTQRIARPEFLNVRIRRCPMRAAEKVCERWDVHVPNFLMVDSATCALSITGDYEPRPSPLTEKHSFSPTSHSLKPVRVLLDNNLPSAKTDDDGGSSGGVLPSRIGETREFQSCRSRLTVRQTKQVLLEPKHSDKRTRLLCRPEDLVPFSGLFGYCTRGCASRLEVVKSDIGGQKEWLTAVV